MSESHMHCDDEDRCKNKGLDCEHCERSYYFEESSDCFQEIEEEESK